ncbi:MAG TPA: DEAD/DEAH box helicase family protein [Solirubrobacteraceae bacterium]|nr:DEAD/DEAH box helicase family protein [Solirubrobacteraceae bacterium]
MPPAVRPSANRHPLRRWQERAMEALGAWSGAEPILISAAPGAGKTRPALEFARAQLLAGRIGAVIVACPTAPLTRQWAHAAHELGIDLAPDADSPRPPSGFHGVSVTYARIAKAPRRWASAIPRSTLLIADEAHHLGEDLTWGESFATAFAERAHWLLLSGTPFRSDATPIPGVSYDSDGIAEPDVSYSFAQAVADGVCRPVSFVAYDGTLSWRSGDDVIESGFDTVLSTREASRRYRTAISTELPDGLPRILREADARLRTVRQDGHPDAGGLVVAADSGHARQIARLLREATGRSPVVVLHAEARAAARLAEFRTSREPWIVAVNMVSEGVDIPRLRVGVYATAAKTPLIFRQIVGRFVRTIPDRPQEPSWLYVPADPVLRDHAATIEYEVRRALRRPGETDPGDLEEPRERRRTEPTPALDFEPVSADVAPQMSLFGGAAAAAPPRPAPAAACWLTPESEEPEPEPVAVPAFERRARLRDERHRLVSEVRRRDGTSHREINAWLNRALGITSVEQATLPQLEKSVELLMDKLTARR